MLRPSLMLALLATALATPVATQPPDAREVRNVRFSVQEVGDSLTFVLEWVPPARGRRATPITGFEWQFQYSTDDVLGFNPDYILATGEVNGEARQATATIYHDCADGALYYGGRVRALGGWDPAEAPWGTSAGILVACDDSPPGPPEVQVDTLPLDTLPTPPDEVEWALSQPTEHASISGLTLSATALGTGASLCAYTYRDGVRRKATTRVVPDPAPVKLVRTGYRVEVEPMATAQACWRLTTLPEE